MAFFEEKPMFDHKNKVIRLRKIMTPQQIILLIKDHFNEDEYLSERAPYQKIYTEFGLSVKLTDGWSFDKKTVSLHKQKDNKRYRNFRKANPGVISAEFKRV